LNEILFRLITTLTCQFLTSSQAISIRPARENEANVYA
jgi:hypothetical protein